MVSQAISQGQGRGKKRGAHDAQILFPPQAIVGWKQKKEMRCPLSRSCQCHSSSWASLLLSHLSFDDGDSGNLSVYSKDWLPTWY